MIRAWSNLRGLPSPPRMNIGLTINKDDLYRLQTLKSKFDKSTILSPNMTIKP